MVLSCMVIWFTPVNHDRAVGLFSFLKENMKIASNKFFGHLYSILIDWITIPFQNFEDTFRDTAEHQSQQ